MNATHAMIIFHTTAMTISHFLTSSQLEDLIKMELTDEKNRIGLGTAQYGMAYGINNKSGRVKFDEIIAILDRAKNVGINTIDTARNYGRSEKVIGRYIAKQKTNDFNVITKIDNLERSIEKQIKDSIFNLNANPYAILAHSSDIYSKSLFQDQILKLKNKLPFKLGVSIYTIEEIERVFYSKLKLDLIQLPLNILDTKIFKKWIAKKLLKEVESKYTLDSYFCQGLLYFSNDQILKTFPGLYEPFKIKYIGK